MKTTITILALFLVTMQSFAQINRDYKNQIKSKYGSSLKLPLLKSTKYERISDDLLLNFGKNINKVTTLSEIPKLPSKESGVLSATFSPSTMTARNAKLKIFGLYDGKMISLAKARRRSGEGLVLEFNSKIGKVYRVTVNFDAEFDASKYHNLHTEIRLSGSAFFAEFKIKEGENTIDFLTQTVSDSNHFIFLLGYSSLKKGSQRMDGYYEFKINEVKIRQLED